MAEESAEATTHWYVRRGTTVKGPFPASQIAKYVLLGRVGLGDEVSQDRRSWRRVRDVSRLVPEAMRRGADREELQMLRQGEDERSGRERRHRRPPPAEADLQPRGPDRRGAESEAMVRHRRQKAELLERLREGSEKERRSRRWILPASVVAVAVVVALGFLIGPTSVGDAPDCTLGPAPGVNWNNCSQDLLKARNADLTGARIRNASLREADLLGAGLAGADLAYTDLTKANLSYGNLQGADLKGATLKAADLTYADLTGADLSYADLRGASLGGAETSGAVLAGTVWYDGTTCARDSVGRCRPAAAR